MNRISYLAVLCLATAACGGGDSKSATEIAQQGINQVCQQAFDCMDSFPTDQGVTFEQVFGSSVSECETTLSGLLGLDKLQASIDAGRVVYNADDAQTCIDNTDLGTCDQLWSGMQPDDPPECDTAFVGQVADGDMCESQFDCAGTGSDCTDGVCTPPSNGTALERHLTRGAAAWLDTLAR